jgi:hypothetical protein
VKVLLDECVDWRLARDISGHSVKTARQMGWTTIKNGELLSLAAAEFDVCHRGSELVFSAEAGFLPGRSDRARRISQTLAFRWNRQACILSERRFVVVSGGRSRKSHCRILNRRD